MASSISIKIEGIAELKKQLPGTPPIVTRGLKLIMQRAAREGAAIFRAGAPHGTGRLARSARADARLFSAAVTFDAIGKATYKGKPYAYGWRINARGRHKGYNDRIKASIQRTVVPKLAAAVAREIEKSWRA